jgi:hypothetical protein
VLDGCLDMLLLLGGPQESLRLRWKSDERSWVFATLQYTGAVVLPTAWCIARFRWLGLEGSG